MKTKQLTFILSLTFLFLFSGFIYGEELEVKMEYYDNGKLKKEIHFKNGVKEGLAIYWYESGTKKLRAKNNNGKFKRYLGTESEDLNIDESQEPIKEFTGIL